MNKKIENNEKVNIKFLEDCKEIVKSVIDMYDLHDAYDFLRKLQVLNQTPFIVTGLSYFETAMIYGYIMQIDMPSFPIINTSYTFQELLNLNITLFINEYCMFKDIVLGTISRIIYVCSKTTKNYMFSIPSKSLLKLQTIITNWFAVYENMGGDIKISIIPNYIDLVYQVLEVEIADQNITCNTNQKTILLSHTLEYVKGLDICDVKRFIKNSLNILKLLTTNTYKWENYKELCDNWIAAKDDDLKGSDTSDTSRS